MTSLKKLLNYDQFYLVGIKGVAMSSLAQILIQAGKKVRGSDLEEGFVTDSLLKEHRITIDHHFDPQLINKNIDCLIYSGGHQGKENPQVIKAQKLQIPVYSQAEAIAIFANSQSPIAICGVGGKSTVSAMLSFVLNQSAYPSSYSVGVGRIMGLAYTGRWDTKSKHFVIEADEYAVNPYQARKGELIIPRFSFLNPTAIVCVGIQYDHPDVYSNINQTKSVFRQFFDKLTFNQPLFINGDNQNLQQIINKKSDYIISYGLKSHNHYYLINYTINNQRAIAQVRTPSKQTLTLTLNIPGKYNMLNALACLAVCQYLKIEDEQTILALKKFNSTKRRFEYLGEYGKARIYDDYAHHPYEILNVIQAFNQWEQDRERWIVFQPHTFSRTKNLLKEFTQAFETADKIILAPIFASAREDIDHSISSQDLATQISILWPHKTVIVTQSLKHTHQIITDIIHHNSADTAIITIGAGDIYKVTEQLVL